MLYYNKKYEIKALIFLHGGIIWKRKRFQKLTKHIGTIQQTNGLEPLDCRNTVYGVSLKMSFIYLEMLPERKYSKSAVEVVIL